MTRASTGSEAKLKRFANGTPSHQRLAAAGTRAFEAHARVRRFAERLCDELDQVTSPHGVPVTDLDPEDSMVIAVEKVIATSTEVVAEVARPRVATRLGVSPIPKPTAKSR